MLGRLIFAFFLILQGAILGSHAQAHQTGESYLYIQVSEERLIGRYEIPLRDLGLLFDLDENGDGKVSEEEYEARVEEVHAHFQPLIKFEIDGQKAPIAFTDVDYLVTPGFTFSLNSFEVDWRGPVPDTISVIHTSSYDDVDPDHRVLFVIESNVKTGLKDNEAQYLFIFGKGTTREEINLTGLSPWDAFWAFVEHGIHHLIIGLDHIFFLLALVFPAVLTVRGGKWTAAPSFGAALWNLIKIATVFTIAHSVTLALAALELVRLPSGPVEALIALSIVAAAAGNIFIVGRRWVYPAVFLLGLLHGLGFANVLQPLAMEPINILPSLLGFNIGVEIGQIMTLALPFVLLFFIRNWSGYVPYILKGGSSVLIVVAVYWFAERGLDMAQRFWGMT